MYREYLLDLYKFPHNFGTLQKFTHEGHHSNNSCGDMLFFQFYVKDNKIENVMFTGSGCVISIASASLLTDAIKGKTLEEADKISADDILSMLTVPISPARIKCALISLDALKSTVEKSK